MRTFLAVTWWTALVVLLTLKLSGAALSWWVVLSPIWGIPALAAALLAIMLVLVAFIDLGLGNKPDSPKL